MQTQTSAKYLNKSFWKNKNVLVTGINGFIGGNLAKVLLSLGATVIGITNKNYKNKFLIFEKIHNKLNFHKVDIKNYSALEKVVNLYSIDMCIHLAAQVDVNIAKTNPYETFEANIKGTYNLLEILRKKGNIK